MYEWIKRATGWVAGLASFAYAIVLWIAVRDGPGGFEISMEVGIPCVGAIAALIVVAVILRLAEWIDDRNSQSGYEREGRIIKRLESHQSELFELLANVVEHRIKHNGKHLCDKIKEETTAAIRAEIAAAVEEIRAATIRAAIVRQASEAAAAAADEHAPVTHIPNRRR